MKEWNGHCQRCYKKAQAHIMSMFNTDLICLDCKKAEEKRPGYEAARDAEAAECRRGNFNFAGVGWRGGRR